MGLAAIKRILANSEAMDELRLQATKTQFLDRLKNSATALEMAGLADGTNADVHKITDELDAQIIAIGKRSDDSWKPGQ